jgi:hydroxyacylglutathione hydrolase
MIISMGVYEIETFAVGAFQCNCSLLINTETKEALVVDPGDEPFEILERLEYHGVHLRALWHTHAHIDHIGATKALYETCAQKALEDEKPAPLIYLHEGDRWLYENVALQAQMLRMAPFAVTDAWTPIKEGQSYAGFPGTRALHTPGHTPGSCCLDVKAETSIIAPRNYGRGFSGPASRVLLSGDTLFKDSVGRTDLWGGDQNLLFRSIKGKLFNLSKEDDCLVIPGHGPFTSIESEKKSNPFLQGL